MTPHPYSTEVRTYMVRMFSTLSEKGKRHYAAIEAIKLGHGGIGYISELFGLHPDTVSQGMRELKEDDLPPSDRIRRPGGGRKNNSVVEDEDTQLKFVQILNTYRAGSPMNPGVVYTHLRPRELAQRMEDEQGVSLTRYGIVQLLAKMGMKRRSLSKSGTAHNVEGRNEQFLYIQGLIKEYQAAGCAIYSIDSKKKEYLGSLYRAGKLFTQQALVCQDHDFPSLATGKVAPYGIYDVGRNRGYVYLNESADTSDYAADCLDRVLSRHHAAHYSGTKKVLLLADCGGSNGANRHRFKEMLQWLADKHGLDIRVAHYPSYCSKYNPCDHRLFAHVSRAMSGVMLDSVITMRDLIKSRARTQTGLRVLVQQIKKVYHKGVKATKEFMRNSPVIFDPQLPKWNYRFTPLLSQI